MARFARKLPRGAKLVWRKFPGQKGQLWWDDRTSGNRSHVSVQLKSRGPWKRLMQRIARFFDRMAY